MVVDWNAAFEKVRTESANGISGTVKSKTAEVSKETAAALEGWFASGESLDALVQSRWNPALASTAQWLGRATRNHLYDCVRTPYGGAEPAAAAVGDLHIAGFDLGPVVEAARAALDEPEAAESYAMALKHEQVPVRKTFGDWMLFRSAASVRRKLFGGESEREIDPAVKAKRLAEPCREALLGAIDETVQAKFPLLPGRFSERLLAGYATKFRDGVALGLGELREKLEQQRVDLQTPFAANIRILESLQVLDETCADVAAEINKIAVLENAVAPELAPAIEANAAEAVPQESAAS